MDNTRYSASIIDAGIDWLTVTEKTGTPSGEALREITTAFLLDSAEEGAGLRDMAPQGFQGGGNEFGFMGFRDNLIMARVSGRNANEYAERLRKTGEKFHVTRIDLQTTAGYLENVGSFGTSLLGVVRATERRAGKTRRAAAVLYQADKRDTGVSVGRRDSQTFIRCYHPRTAGHLEYDSQALRFEVEYKQDRARTVWAMATKADALQYLAAGQVQGELMKHGINEPWFRAHSFPPVKTDFNPTDNEKRLEWLKTSVGPAMAKLMQNPRYRLQVVQWYNGIAEETGDKQSEATLKRRQAAIAEERVYFEEKDYELSRSDPQAVRPVQTLDEYLPHQNG